ncbi:MAG: DUF4038 domain-containing protein [Verrucomicrobia bacterium]|nr:DUF4038 domain-containing protein [Verrucomicrobiota bacterium]
MNLRTMIRHFIPTIPLALAMPLAAAPPAAVQWRVAEFSFEGKLDYAGQPDGVGLEAEFHGPDGARFTVPGFWDGNKSWKIRFAPTAPGEWTYQTHAVEEAARVVETLYSGKILRGGDPGEEIDVAVSGCAEIELVVRDADDGSEYDHADWADARFVRKDGVEVGMDTLAPLRATQGHGELAKGKNLFGTDLTIGGKAFFHGLGSHSPGRISYRLDGAEARFRATVGVDSRVGKHGSVRFEVLGIRSNKAQIGRRDPGLDNRRGSFHASPAAGDNPLHRHGGFLRTSADGHSLTYTDGTPFFWLGDTWWFCPSDLVPIDGSTNPEIPSAYLHLLNVRTKQGFTAIHMAFLGTIGGYNPFDEPARGAGLDPIYWRKVDRYIDEANTRGLVPVIGLGWCGRPLDPADWRRLWRHVIARYGAHAVTWLICGEYNVRGAEDRVADTLRLGRFIRDTDPYHRAMTAHPWYFEGDKRQAWSEPWYDFIMFQGGHGAPPPARLYQETHARQPAKPLLEAECRYEGIHTFTDREVREVAWRAILSGSFGFTYGSQGLWYPTQNETDRKTDEWGTPLVWWKAVGRPGAEQLGHLRKILETTSWWKLAPRPDLVSPSAGTGGVVVLEDLMKRFGEAKATNAHWCRLGDGEPPRIELHPPGSGDGTLEFPPIRLPEVKPGEQLRFLTAFGFNPGARLDDPDNPSNGVGFSIRADGKDLANAKHHGKTWIYQNVDLTALAGKFVAITLGTNADGNMNWDHAAFRQPVIVRVPAGQSDPMRAEISGPPPRQVLAKADGDRVILLHYAAGEGAIRWNLKPLPDSARYRAVWHNPRTGAKIPAETIVVRESALPLPAPPDTEDWVLILNRME